MKLVKGPYDWKTDAITSRPVTPQCFDGLLTTDRNITVESRLRRNASLRNDWLSLLGHLTKSVSLLIQIRSYSMSVSRVYISCSTAHLTDISLALYLLVPFSRNGRLRKRQVESQWRGRPLFVGNIRRYFKISFDQDTAHSDHAIHHTVYYYDSHFLPISLAVSIHLPQH